MQRTGEYYLFLHFFAASYWGFAMGIFFKISIQVQQQQNVIYCA